jgi:histidinol-phosphate aminotransferase
MPHYEPGLTTAEVLARFGLASAVKLASNESPFPPMPEVAEAVAAGVAGLNRYPDGPARTLRRELAERHGVDADQVTVGNGSCELLLLAGQALLDPGTTVMYAAPSFSLYGHLAAAAGADAVEIPLADDDGHDLDHMAAMVDERTRLVIVCNPNNPTGVYRSADAIESFLDQIPDDLPVLVDEAYNEFVAAPDRGRVLSLARHRPNLLVTRTFSKAHGLCGLRVGYALGSAAWVAALDTVRQPFNTNALAQAAAIESFRRQGELDRRVRATVAARHALVAELAGEGWGVVPSEANFILATPPPHLGSGPRVHTELLRRGVIVREGTSLGCPGRLRISIGTPEEHDVFRAARADLAAAAA